MHGGSGKIAALCYHPTQRLTCTFTAHPFVAGQTARPPPSPTSTPTTAFADESLGSASLSTNASGGKVSEMRYYPYGETRSGTTATDRRYTGQRQEASLGLYDYNARSYDPSLSRFIQADSMVPSPANPQSLNRYAYTLNNPLRYTDPSGHDLMIVGGVGGDFDVAKWKDWIMAYKGWNESQWNEFYGNKEEWSDSNFAAGLARLDKEGIRIFSWGGSTLSEKRENAQHKWTDDAMAEELADEMAGMQDITLLGLSKGGNLVMHYLKRLEAGKLDVDAPRPLHAILVSPATHPGGVFRYTDPFLNNSVPNTGPETVNICAVGDIACPLKVRGALNINPPESFGHTGPKGHFAHGVYANSVYASLNIQGDHEAYSKYVPR